MNKLTDIAPPPETFLQCQLCGAEFQDRCDIDLWEECDETEAPTGAYLIVGRRCGCLETHIDPHPRLYMKVAWSRGGPGRFTLLCGDCPHREGFDCTHPNLKKNGGKGLEIQFQPLFHGIVCFGNGRALTGMDLAPATKCEGKR